MSGVEGRKVRSDKKWSVQPFVSTELRDCIYRLNYITGIPVKDVIEKICENGMRNRRVLSYISMNFRRDLRINNSIYLGDMERVPVSKRSAAGVNERISTRVTGTMHDALKALAYALDCSTAKACALLLDATVRDVEFVNGFVEGYLTKHVDKQRMRELKKVLEYINAHNPYKEEISWANLFSYLVDEVQIHAEKVQDTVTDFVVHRWDRS